MFLRSVVVRLFLLLALAVSFDAQTPVAHPTSTFESVVAARFSKGDPAWKFEWFCPVSTDIVAARVLREYGAMFVASEAVILAPTCIYPGETSVIEFRKRLPTKSLVIAGVNVTLQTPAAEALQRAVMQAEELGMRISAYDGAIAGSRSYGDTLMLWNGRFFSGLDYWVRRGRLTEADRLAVSGMDLHKRIAQILTWESQGIYFSTDRTRSIFSSTAPPGSSQHLSMIAFDVAEYGRTEIREILRENGWHQTVVGDPLHFTFLGLQENELTMRGLRLVERGGNRYWVPTLVPIMR
ncbi:MAG TPA: hypothetical protein VNA22_09560 [Pyrinomonadaceae bacterium]|nr:hypothetical protein [Pyrinomonadaceae bacterium]